MADEKDQSQTEKTEVVQLDIEKTLPEQVVKELKSGKFKTTEEAAKYLKNHYFELAKNEGYAPTKDVQVGTHKAAQNSLKEALAAVDEMLDLPETAQTKDYFTAVASKIKQLKDTPKSGLSDDEKKQLADLQQTQKMLKDAQKALEETKKALADKDTEYKTKFENTIKNSFAESAFEKAFSETAASRLPDVKLRTIKTIFKEDYMLDVALNSDGAPTGYTIRNKADNSKATKSDNSFFENLNDLLLHIYKEEALAVSQPAQKQQAGSGAFPPKDGEKSNGFKSKSLPPV
jgi:hypothetical protein